MLASVAKAKRGGVSKVVLDGGTRCNGGGGVGVLISCRRPPPPSLCTEKAFDCGPQPTECVTVDSTEMRTLSLFISPTNERHTHIRTHTRTYVIAPLMPVVNYVGYFYS